MKIIFSRKGLDSSFGNYASPILPNGQLCWLPIPEENNKKPGLPTYSDILFKDTNLGEVIESLSSKRILGNKTIHLDPDIYQHHKKRKSNWRPAFGQTGAAQSHLKNKGVGPGDIFLFFGWFKQCESINGKLKYVKSAPDLHILYGWLQISELIRVNEYHQTLNLFNIEKGRNIPEWLKEHPHLIGNSYGDLDTLYLSTDKLTVNNITTDYPGSGMFNFLNKKHILTKNGKTRSVWQLPNWMYPSGQKLPLSYNEKLDKWIQKDGEVLLRIASRGQEFVLDTSFYPEANSWLIDVIKAGMNEDG